VQRLGAVEVVKDSNRPDEGCLAREGTPKNPLGGTVL
jgi:hypothetical protein